MRLWEGGEMGARHTCPLCRVASQPQIHFKDSPMVLVCLSATVIKHPDPKQLKVQGFLLASTSRSQFIIERSQGRNLEQKPQRDLLSRFSLPHAQLNFLIQPRSIYLGMLLPTVG